jgi:hypothetical protein
MKCNCGKNIGIIRRLFLTKIDCVTWASKSNFCSNECFNKSQEKFWSKMKDGSKN